MRTIKISGRLASHFCADEISADMVKASYDAAERVVQNPEKFPRADFATLSWLAEALFELSPTAAMEGQ